MEQQMSLVTLGVADLARVVDEQIVRQGIGKLFG